MDRVVWALTLAGPAAAGARTAHVTLLERSPSPEAGARPLKVAPRGRTGNDPSVPTPAGGTRTFGLGRGQIALAKVCILRSMPRTRTVAQATEHDSALARQIGVRIREARKRAGLTQQQLAGDRYTKAYVSALETGIARPSMVALSYLAERLSLPPSHFLDERNPTWNRLEVDMLLAAGDWQAAADGYADLLDEAPDDQGRAEILRGRAEALARLARGRATIA